MAWKWAERKIRYLPGKHRIWVYEVELTDVEPDANGLRADPGSVMARTGWVVRELGSFVSPAEADAAVGCA